MNILQKAGFAVLLIFVHTAKKLDESRGIIYVIYGLFLIPIFIIMWMIMLALIINFLLINDDARNTKV
jgi:uncharacterized membrane protein